MKDRSLPFVQGSGVTVALKSADERTAERLRLQIASGVDRTAAARASGRLAIDGIAP